MDDDAHIPQVDNDTANYIIAYFPNLMTRAENHAWGRLICTMKATKGRDDFAAQEATLLNPHWAKHMSNDDEVVRLARQGCRHFLTVAAARILAERSSELYLK